MSDLARVHAWFAAGVLLRPDYSRPSTVSLARALASLSGAAIELDEPSQRLAEAIGRARHYVFLLADGLGMDLLRRRPNAFLARHNLLELRSVFPSSTAPALTSLATGDWPAGHGVTSWFLYLPQRRLHTICLPFVERFSRRPLSEAGLSAADIFDAPVLASQQQCDYLALLPAPICGSVYSRYTLGGRQAKPYQTLSQAFAYVQERVASVRSPAFTYVYYSGVDSAAHSHGPASPQVARTVEELDEAVAVLHRSLAGRARLVVSADHGAFDVAPGQKLLLSTDDPLLSLLVTPPSGEPPVPMFHVRPGCEDEFAEAFRSRFGDAMALLTTDEVEELRLMGPGRLASATRARLGQFLALAGDGAALVFEHDGALLQMKGFHGGLTPREVCVPLVVA